MIPFKKYTAEFTQLILREASKLTALIRGGSNGRIEVYGDSVIRGVYLDENCKMRPYRERFDSVRRDFLLTVDNCAHIGYTTANGLELMQRRLKSENAPSLVMLEFGGNDCNFKWDDVAKAPQSEHIPAVQEPEFRKNYEAMIGLVRACGANAVVILPPPIDAAKFLSYVCERGGLDKSAILSWLGDESMIYRWQEHYSQTAQEIADEKGCPCIDLRKPFIVRHDYEELISRDGIHPTPKGHAIIDETIHDFFADISNDDQAKTS